MHVVAKFFSFVPPRKPLTSRMASLSPRRSRCVAATYLTCACLMVALTTAQSTAGATVVGATIVAGHSFDASSIFDAPLHVGPTISIVLDPIGNVTWNSNKKAIVSGIRFTTPVRGYNDPLGLTNLLEQGLAIETSWVSSDMKMLNISLTATQCYLPKQDATLVLELGPNVTNRFGTRVAETSEQLSNRSMLTVTILAALDNSLQVDGLVVSGLIISCCGLTFLLGNWFDALLTLMQLQLLVLISFTSCAPRGASVIFNKCVWVLWPLSTYSSDVTNPEDQGRMVFNFVFIGVTLFVQCVAVVLFAYFSGTMVARNPNRVILDPKSRVKFPQGTLFVAGFLFQGSVRSCIKTFALHYLGYLGESSAGPLALAVATCVSLFVQLFVTWIAVFRVVSQQVFVEPLTKSFFTWAFIGGNWKDAESRKQWGVFFDGLNGSSFWFFAAVFTLCAANSMLAGFVPGTVSDCTTQFYLMLVVALLQSTIVFVRRPFKALVHNVLNIVVSMLQVVVTIAFVSSMECTRMQSRFSSLSVWFALCAIFVKSALVMVLQMVVRVRQAIQAPLVVPLAVNDSISPQRHNDRDGLRRQMARALKEIDTDLLDGDSRHRFDELAMSLLAQVDARDAERSVLYNLDAATGAAAQYLNTMYKPLLPAPRLIDDVVISREVGFGGAGGLPAPEGPSTALRLAQPCGMCCDADCLYIVDASNNRILAHSFLHRRTTTLCGGDSLGGYAGDLASDTTTVLMDGPRFIALGHRCLYVSDTGNDCVRRVDLSTGQVVTILGGEAAATTTTLCRPMGLQCAGYTLYVADSGNHRIIAYDFQENMCQVVCGTGFPGYDGDGATAARARLNSPQGIFLRPSDHHLYIADTGNHRIVCVDAASRKLRLVLGTPGCAGESDTAQAAVPGRSVQLCMPTDVSGGPDNSLLVVDGGNAKVWIVNRFGHAKVLIPASDVVIPRHICVPRSLQIGAASGGVFGDSDKSAQVHTSSPGDDTRSLKFRSGMMLSAALSGAPSLVPRQKTIVSETSTDFVFYLSDSVQHMVVAVDAGAKREARFERSHLYGMAHPEIFLQKNETSSSERRSSSIMQSSRLRSYSTATLSEAGAPLGGATKDQRTSPSLSRSLSRDESIDGMSPISAAVGPDYSAVASPPLALRSMPSAKYVRPSAGRRNAAHVYQTGKAAVWAQSTQQQQATVLNSDSEDDDNML